MTRYQTVAVLAGAYMRDGTMLTHVGAAVRDDFDEPDALLCKRAKPENCTAWSLTREERDAPATCSVCAKRDPRTR